MNMATNALFATVAALSGDPARAAMLQALMDGRALTATELAKVAGVTPQTASGHLNRMTATGLLSVEKQGRHRYHRLAAPSVAHMLESIMQMASELEPAGRKLSIGPKDAALRRARTCYDHLAGQLGVAIADGLMQHGYVELAGDAGNHGEGRVRLRSARIRPDGVAGIDHGVVLQEQRIGAQMAAIDEMHASEPAPAFEPVHPPQSRNLEVLECGPIRHG